MDLPTPPKDIGLRNIIDKLAEFVARNGPEFEAITKVKQQGNPKFGFLYGGDYYQYYQWRVSTEETKVLQRLIDKNQQGSLSQAQNLPPSSSSLASQTGAANVPTTAVTSAGHGLAANAPPLSSPAVGNSWDNNTASVNNPNNGGGGTQMAETSAMQSAYGAQLEALSAQQTTLRDQISQSEQNLAAQQGVLAQQQQAHIDEAIVAAQHESLVKLAIEHNIRLSEFDDVLQPIVDSCTKDSISAGKNWILQHTTDSPKCNVILQYLLKKALLNGAPFTQKLHLIYLVNDVLHHCVRKRADDLKNQLESIVIPMFCSGQIQANDDQKAKLTKLLSLWESKANFFDACVISKLKSPVSSMQEYRTNLLNTYATLVATITQQTSGTFESYKQQHQAFIQHAGQQIVLLETQMQELAEKQKLAVAAAAAIMAATAAAAAAAKPLNPFGQGNNNGGGGGMNNGSGGGNMMQHNAMMAGQQMPNMQQPPPMGGDGGGAPVHQNPFGGNSSGMDMGGFAAHQFQQQPSNHQQPPQQQQQQQPLDAGFDLPPPNFMLPDMSKPPPGFANPPPLSADAAMAAAAAAMADEQMALAPSVPQEVKPVAPFYELPAGLMVPLIRLEDYEYRPLDPEDLRLPPPLPPSDRLLSAVDAFYAPPSHDRPRDGEGWEKLALYEYYKVKNSARKTKEEEIANGSRQRSRSPSPIVIEAPRPIKLNKRRYRSKSRSRSRSPIAKADETQQQQEQQQQQQSDASEQQQQRKSDSPPPPQQLSSDEQQASGRNTGRKPAGQFGAGSPVRDRSRSISPMPTRVDRDRSISPPPASFLGGGGGGGGNFAKPASEGIVESNKGHQMLMRMGWAGSGTGLGSHGQGIDAPISGGEVRDRQDQFKGVGISLNDPYENFRKSKGQAFVHRMRARDPDAPAVPTKNGKPEAN